MVSLIFNPKQAAVKDKADAQRRKSRHGSITDIKLSEASAETVASSSSAEPTTVPQEDPSVISSSSSHKTKSSTKSSQRASCSSKKKYTKNERHLIKLMKFCNKFTNAQDYLAFFTETAVFCPEDTPAMPIAAVAGIVEILHKSFPDFQFDHQSVKEVKPGCVVVEGAQFHGHFTGDPYTFMPGQLPAMPANGKRVQVDPERWFMDMSEDGKIEKFSVISDGLVTGPAGVYEQVGGKL